MRQSIDRAHIMRWVVSPLFALLAIVSVIVGVCNATIWKPNPIVIAHARVTGMRYIVTDPGVLNLVDNRVRIAASVEGTRKPVCIAVGLAKDVRGWIGDEPVARITGLRDWNNLSVITSSKQVRRDASVSDRPAEHEVALKNSHLWSNVSCQLGLSRLFINTNDFAHLSDSTFGIPPSVDASKASQPSEKTNEAQSVRHLTHATRRVALIDLGENRRSVTIDLRWRRHHLPDFATPLYFIAGLCFVLAVVSATIFAMEPRRRRNKRLVESRGSIMPSEERNEVSISEAFAGTLRGVAGAHSSKKKRSRSRGRHGAHGRGAQANNLQVSSNVDRDVNAATTVISREDFQAYFARLAQQESAKQSVSSTQPVSLTSTEQVEYKFIGKTRTAGGQQAVAGNEQSQVYDGVRRQARAARKQRTQNISQQAYQHSDADKLRGRLPRTNNTSGKQEPQVNVGRDSQLHHVNRVHSNAGKKRKQKREDLKQIQRLNMSRNSTLHETQQNDSADEASRVGEHRKNRAGYYTSHSQKRVSSTREVSYNRSERYRNDSVNNHSDNKNEHIAHQEGTSLRRNKRAQKVTGSVRNIAHSQYTHVHTNRNVRLEQDHQTHSDTGRSHTAK